MADIRPDLGAIFGDALGAAATVTPPGASAISTRVVLHPPRYAEFVSGSAQPLGSPIREVSVRRDDVATLKSGTTIKITEGPEIDKTYTVDAIVDQDAEVTRAVIR